MIWEKLAKKFPFISGYFRELFNTDKKRFPQSIVFEGLDAYAQCFYSLELARVLNCLEDGNENCSCLNCRWIRENKHPAVNFVSQLHYKTSDDDAKTVISVTQAKNIEKSLRETSDYHRFFIFFDAKAANMDRLALQSCGEFQPEGYNICPDEDWTLNHINSQTFNPSAPNVLLKSVEEPPERTTFVFLTKNRADLINTIVSRSQVFKMPALQEKQDYSYIEELFLGYPDIDFQKAFEISELMQSYIKDGTTSSNALTDGILAYLTNEIKFSDNFSYINKLNRDIKLLSEAKKWQASSVSDKVVFDTLMLKIARNRL